MEAQEIDATLDELENRLDRLRALYEQYFLGIEKIEPTVARKDVDRRFWLLRKTQIRNTARRFRLQTLTQRYNTFQQHWTRICREIENGTYVRHLLKVKKNFGEEPKTWAARKRLGLLRKGAGDEAEPAEEPAEAAAAEPGDERELAGMLTGGDLDAEVLAATAAAFEHAERPRPARPAAQERYSLDDLGPLNLDFDDDGQPTLPPPRAAPVPAQPKAAAPAPTTGVAAGVKVPTFPPPVPIGAAAKPAAGGRPPLPARPPIPGAPRVPSAVAAPPAPPAEPFPPAPSSPTSSPPPAPRPKLPSVAGVRPPLPSSNGAPLPARPPLPGASPAARPPLPGATPAARPPLPPRAPQAGAPAGQAPPQRPAPVPGTAPRPGGPGPNPAPGTAARPGEARPNPAAGPMPNPAPAAPAARPVAASGNPAPAPRPNPAATAAATRPAEPRPAAPAAAAAKDLSDDRLKQLHRELIETKKKLNLDSNLSYDSLSKSLRDTERKLRAEHQGRSVDFQVVVKDGKAVVKPIVRK